MSSTIVIDFLITLSLFGSDDAYLCVNIKRENMSKTSLGQQISRLIWLAEHIGGRTGVEIRNLWNDVFNEKLAESTFHRWRKDVEDLFDISIECDFKKERRYYFAENFEKKQSNYHHWLIDSFYISNLMKYSRELQSQIMFEPMENRFLTDILEAMRDHKVLRITHEKFGSSEPTTRTVKPYGLKQFRQRWYMVAQVKEHNNKVLTYALDDRIKSIERTDDSYKIPADFNIEKYFEHIYGVTMPNREPGEKPEEVVIRLNDYQANYLHTMPLHPTQVFLGDNTFGFTLFLANDDERGYTEDFYRELRAYGPSLEVLEPEWLREKFREEAERTLRAYKKSRGKK